MISSMTGFGSSTLENDKISLSVQIKSVNGRFLETRFRMPREYSALENEMKKTITAVIQRGTVEISINRVLKGDAAAVSVEPNIPLAKGWMKAAQALAKDLKLEMPKNVEPLMRVNDIIQITERGELPSWEKENLIRSLQEALSLCLAEKKREGQAQYKIFADILDELVLFVDGVKKRKSKIDGELKTKLQERLKLLDASIEVDPQRLAQEVIFLLEKGDIAEEITRAETHLKAYRDVLNENTSVGKKLEFYTQELHREINTMGSKTQSLDVTLDIIQAKTLVERLREQVQNVE